MKKNPKNRREREKKAEKETGRKFEKWKSWPCVWIDWHTSYFKHWISVWTEWLGLFCVFREKEKCVAHFPPKTILLDKYEKLGQKQFITSNSKCFPHVEKLIIIYLFLFWRHTCSLCWKIFVRWKWTSFNWRKIFGIFYLISPSYSSGIMRWRWCWHFGNFFPRSKLPLETKKSIKCCLF